MIIKKRISIKTNNISNKNIIKINNNESNNSKGEKIINISICLKKIKVIRDNK